MRQNEVRLDTESLAASNTACEFPTCEHIAVGAVKIGKYMPLFCTHHVSMIEAGGAERETVRRALIAHRGQVDRETNIPERWR